MIGDWKITKQRGGNQYPLTNHFTTAIRNIYLTMIIISTLLALNLGCRAVNVPERDTTPMQLIPKEVENLRLRDTIEMRMVWVIGAERGAKGTYCDKSDMTYAIEIYRFSARSEANKVASGIKHDIEIEPPQKASMVFTSGVFLFHVYVTEAIRPRCLSVLDPAYWGKKEFLTPARAVQEIARATGFFDSQ